MRFRVPRSWSLRFGFKVSCFGWCVSCLIIHVGSFPKREESPSRALPFRTRFVRGIRYEVSGSSHSGLNVSTFKSFEKFWVPVRFRRRRRTEKKGWIRPVSVPDLGFWATNPAGFRSKVSGSGLRSSCIELRVSHFGFRVAGFVSRVADSKFQVFGCRVFGSRGSVENSA